MVLDLRPPGGPVSVWSVCFILFGAFFMLLGVVAADMLSVLSALVCVTLGAGLWLRQVWARWLGLAMALFMIGWGSITMSNEGVQLLPASLLFAGIGLAAEMWNWQVRKDAPSPDAAEDSRSANSEASEEDVQPALVEQGDRSAVGDESAPTSTA